MALFTGLGLTGTPIGILSVSQDVIIIANYSTYDITGYGLSLNRDLLLPVDQGTYTLDGQDAFLVEIQVYYIDANHTLYLMDTNTQTYFNFERQVSAEQGTYNTDGQNVFLVADKVITSDFGSYLKTGYDSYFILDRFLNSAQGIYQLDGQSLSFDTATNTDFPIGQGTYTINNSFELYLVVDRILTSAYGTYASTGNPVYFLRDLTRTYDYGNYGITGNDAFLNVILSYFLTANHGLYLGDYNSQISFDLDKILVAGQGNYELSGKESSFIRSMIEELETGNYLIDGNVITFNISGVGTPYYFFLFANRN